MRNFNFFNSPFLGDHDCFAHIPQMRIHKPGHGHVPMPSVPPVNIAETSDGFSIEMAAPGYTKADFVVSVDKNLLTVSVDKAQENPAEAPDSDSGNRKVYRREFCYGSFSRSFTLPDNVDTSKISGTYENGILILGIPKAEARDTRLSVEIK